MIQIFIPGEPDTATAQQKGVRVKKSRTGKFYAQFYTKPEVKKTIDKLTYQLLPYKPDEPLTGPIMVKIIWYFGRGSYPKRYVGTFKETKPDLDNLAKNTLDILNKLKFWDSDDAQVSALILSKYWVEDEDAGIMIIIDNVEPEND